MTEDELLEMIRDAETDEEKRNAIRAYNEWRKRGQ